MRHSIEYWADYYGIDKALPHDEIFRQIGEINHECEEISKRYLFNDLNTELGRSAQDK